MDNTTDTYKVPKTHKGVRIEHLRRYRENENGCWIWQGCDRGVGYGVIHLKVGKGGSVMAHRYFYENSYGKIPKGKFFLHKCDNPTCVNPKHLFLGTALDNMKDKIKKGRQAT